MGFALLAKNIELDGGEIDLLTLDGQTRVAVEVRAITGSGDPIDAVDQAKRRRVARLGRLAGAGRVDFIGIALRPWGFELHWLRG